MNEINILDAYSAVVSQFFDLDGVHQPDIKHF